MNEDTLIILGGMGIIGYFIYKKWKSDIPYQANVEVTPSELTEGQTNLYDKKTNTTYFFREGQWDQLNLAQRLLYGLGLPRKWIFE